MDLFKELIDELKGENLLEDFGDEPASSVPEHSVGTGLISIGKPVARLDGEIQRPSTEGRSAQMAVLDEHEENEPEAVIPSDIPNPVDFEIAGLKPSNGREFYKKRAVGEMSHLQMVEHVLTGVEREYLKILPKTFDDFAAKKALNAFLQVSENENSLQHSEAEFAMMGETEAWCSALAERDRAIPVANIRQFCENSRPALSSQALVALARFYRNVPYSESVRAKFDFVITRLFSRPTVGNKRISLFTREEMLNHLSLLYKEWSSIPLYTADDDESNVLLTALSFEELAIEAENASSFDLLVASDFFGRLGMFKESVSELFFAPNVTAAAVDCNIRVGNAYVDLIDNERVKMDSQSMYSKFGAVDNVTISDAAARTLEIVDILRQQRTSSVKVADAPVPAESPPVQKTRRELNEGKDAAPEFRLGSTNEASRAVIGRFLSGNRWALGIGSLVLVLLLGYFGWATLFPPPKPPDVSARTIELPNSVLRAHLKTARINGANFSGLLHPNWDELPKPKREEFLKIVFDFAKDKGCNQVTLLDSEGKPAANASSAKMEVIME
jgi:hypothetical protein